MIVFIKYLSAIILFGISGFATGQSYPACKHAGSDPDGDGYGWENNNSCRVISSTQTSVNPVCQFASSDPDGDGYGWENNTSCIVESGGTNPLPTGELLAEETVNLPLPQCSDARFDSDNDGYGWENSRSCTFVNAGDGGRSITDVILVTGQSNALGAETGRLDPMPFDANQDSAVRRVYAFSDNGWGIAGLRQIWDLGWYPRGDIARDPANNFAFHAAKQLVRHDPNRVVGIILITAPGQSIDHWDRNGEFFAQIDLKVRRALAALPGNVKVQGVLWHQGESDYYSTDYYRAKLRGLVSNFRSQSWFAWDGVFVCGETLNAPVNERLMQLNSDGDSRTGCVTAAGLQSVGDAVHFNARSLRILGNRYADEYRSLAW